MILPGAKHGVTLNEILVWFVGGIGLTLLVRMVHLSGLRYRGWIGVQVVILAVLGSGLVWFPDAAGLVSGALLAVLVLLPAIATRRIHRLVAQSRFGDARRLSRLVALLHPWDGWRDAPLLHQALDLANRGRSEEATALLKQVEHADSPTGRAARVHFYLIESQWAEALRWIQESVPADDLRREPAVLACHLRALGETGAVEGLLEAYRERAERNPVVASTDRASLHLFAAAFCGDVTLAEQLMKGALDAFPPETKRFWQGTALQAAGRLGEAEQVFGELLESSSATTPNATTRRRARERLEHPVARFEPDSLGESARGTLSRIRADVEHAGAVGSLASPPVGRARATGVLALLLVGTFLLELPGGSTDAQNLYRLGAMATGGPDNGWRYVAAGFLHHGLGHLVANLLGLWLLGRYVERTFGWRRFLVGYGGLRRVVVLPDRSDHGRPRALPHAERGGLGRDHGAGGHDPGGHVDRLAPSPLSAGTEPGAGCPDHPPAADRVRRPGARGQPDGPRPGRARRAGRGPRAPAPQPDPTIAGVGMLALPPAVQSDHDSPSDDRDATIWTMIHGAAGGDDLRREQFASRYLPLVRRYLGERWRGTPLVETLEDASQEVFLECLREGGVLENADPSRPGGFRAFLFGAVRNVARRQESARPSPRTEGADARPLERVEAREEELGAVLDREWARCLIRQAAEHHRRTALPRGAAAREGVELLRLRFEEGLAIRDIAARWDQEPAAVHRRYRRAREEFRRSLRRVVAFPPPGVERPRSRVRPAPRPAGRGLEKAGIRGRETDRR